MSKTVITPISRKSNLVIQEIGSGILIYDLTDNKAFSLNETSSMIWQLCDGNRTISDIAEIVSEKLTLPISEDFVLIALEQLKKSNLLKNTDEVLIDFDGLSRREVIRKVGFATLAALPVVSSLIAPMAINASSACIPLLSRGCTPVNSRCCSGSQCNQQPGGQPNNICCVGSGSTTPNNDTGAFVDLGTQTTCNNTSSSDKDIACQNNRGSFCCSGRAVWNPSTTCDTQGRIRCNCTT